MGSAAKLGSSRLLPVLTAVVGLAAILVAIVLAPAASGHAPGCRFPKPEPRVGSAERVHAIPHGCVRLAVPLDDRMLPTVVVRQHVRNGATVTRRSRLPDKNLDRANGSVGICGRESIGFAVSYPFVTVFAQEQYDFGTHGECAAGLDEMLLWVGHIGPPPALRITWHTHAPRR